MAVILNSNPDNVKAAVLLTGTTVLYIDKGVTIEEPMFCTMSPGKVQGEVGISFSPVLALSGETTSQPLNGALILVTYTPSGEIIQAFTEFLTGLRAAKAGIAMPGNGASRGLGLVK